MMTDILKNDYFNDPVELWFEILIKNEISLYMQQILIDMYFKYLSEKGKEYYETEKEISNYWDKEINKIKKNKYE